MKITETLLAEHTIFCTVFDEIERILPSLSTAQEAQRMAGIVEAMLKGHGEREASLAYRVLDHVLAQQGQLHRMHSDHEEIDNRLKSVQTAKTALEARRLLKAAILSSREHFRMEEKVIFPILEKVLQPETLEQLGVPWTDRSVTPLGRSATV